MNADDAHTEVVEIGETPGQKISHEIGKPQVLAMLEAARQKEGGQLSLRKFHDYLWLNGNVPIALQQ